MRSNGKKSLYQGNLFLSYLFGSIDSIYRQSGHYIRQCNQLCKTHNLYDKVEYAHAISTAIHRPFRCGN